MLWLELYSGLQDLTKRLEGLISDKSNEFLSSWKRSLARQILDILNDNLNRDLIDYYLVTKIIEETVASIQIPHISYSNQIPNSLNRSGCLKDSEGLNYVAQVKDYLNGLESNIVKDIDNFMASLMAIVSKLDVSNNVFRNCELELIKLKNDIKNKEQIIARKTNIIKELSLIQ